MSIIGEFNKFILGTNVLEEIIKYIDYSTENYDYEGIGIDIGFTARIMKTDILASKYQIHINKNKYPYLIQIIFYSPDEVDHYYYLWSNIKNEFVKPYISLNDNLMDSSDSIESIPHISKIDYSDWEKHRNDVGKWMININESTHDNNLRDAFTELMSNMDYKYSFMNINFIQLKNEEEFGEDELFSNELYLLDTDLGYIVKQRTRNEYEDDKYYYYYKDSKFVDASEIYYDIDEEKISSKEECKGKDFQYYDLTHGCTDLDSYLRDRDDDYDKLEEDYGIIEYYNYNQWKKLYLDQNDKWFNKMNESKEETFIEWLSRKLQINIGKEIGVGLEGIVYELEGDRILKLTDIKVAELYKSLNKNVKGVAKIYQIGWIYPPKRFIMDDDKVVVNKVKIDAVKSKNPKIGYIIMEKVDTSVGEEIEDLMYLLHDFIFSNRGVNRLPEDFRTMFKRYKNQYGFRPGAETLSMIYKFILKNESKFMDHINSTYIGLLPDIFYEIIDIFSSIKNIYPNWEDIHDGQFGRNKNGELVVFDINDDSYNIYSKKTNLLPVPKNIIRESKVFDFKGFLNQ